MKRRPVLGRWWWAAPAAAIACLFVVAGCGGSSQTDRWTPQEVIKHIDEEIGMQWRFVPDAEDESGSLLVSDDDSAGHFSVFVFKQGITAQDFEISNPEFRPQERWRTARGKHSTRNICRGRVSTSS